MSNSSGNGSSATPRPKPRVVPDARPAPNREEIAYWDPKTLCGLLLSHVSELTEQYMRSPLFLVWLRNSIQFENYCARWIGRMQSLQSPSQLFHPPPLNAEETAR